MNILVTGGSGFIGSYLVDGLYELGHKVTILDKSKPRYGIARYECAFNRHNIYASLTDYYTGKYDYIIHLAGMLGTSELMKEKINQQAVETNIIGTLNILDYCAKTGSKLIFISKPNCWVNTYTITKVAAESFVEMYRREKGVEASIVKWFNVYSGRQLLMDDVGYRKAIPTWVVAGLQGKDIEIYGNGEQTMDLIYTTDAVNALFTIMLSWDKCEGKTFEVGSGREVSINYVANLIKEYTGNRSKVTNIPMRAGEVAETHIKANIKPIMEATGWYQQVNLGEGLMATIDWYRRNYIKE